MSSKKKSNSIIENPALSYFSDVDVSEEPADEKSEKNNYTPPDSNKASEENNAARIKYKEPVKIEPVESASASGHQPGYRDMLKKIETRSKRVQCLIQPSLYAKIKDIAGRRGISVNDFIHGALEAFADSEGP